MLRKLRRTMEQIQGYRPGLRRIISDYLSGRISGYLSADKVLLDTDKISEFFPPLFRRIKLFHRVSRLFSLENIKRHLMPNLLGVHQVFQSLVNVFNMSDFKFLTLRLKHLE